MISHVLRTQIDNLMISLESANEQIFQAIRGGKLDRVKRGVKKLMQRKRDTASAAPTVGLAVTLLHSTCEHLEDVADLYDELDLDGGILLQPLQTMRTYREFYDAATAREILSPAKVQAANRLIASSADLRLKLGLYQKQTNFYAELYRSAPPHSCPWLENGLYVSADGALVSCCFIKDSKQYALGSAGDHWDMIATHRETLSRQLKNGLIPPQCTHCSIAQKMHTLAKPETHAEASPQRE
jgi:radical SAM protein with 4Fe4S-binding SPASM domain